VNWRLEDLKNGGTLRDIDGIIYFKDLKICGNIHDPNR
jgi:hypothetical protein